MRKQLLGATAVLLGASTLSLGLAAAPSQAAAWKGLTPIPFPAGTVTDVEVVSTGDGDAVAAAIINGAVHAYTAVNGAWTGPAQVRHDVNATGLVLASNGTGDTAVGWEEQVNGDNRLRVSRQVNATSWTGQHLLTPAGTDVVGTADLGVAGDGRVMAAVTFDGQDIDNKLVVTEWAKGQNPSTPHTLSPADGFNPSLDVNTKGEAIVAYHYDGLVDDVMSVHRRTPGSGWGLGKSTQNFGPIASASDVAISDNGTGQVIYSTVVNGKYVAETSRALPNGNVTSADFVSPTDEMANDPQVDMNSDGSALFAWQSFKDGVTGIRYASAANNADPTNSFLLSGTLPNAESPTPRIGDKGLRVIQHSGNGQITTHYRVSSVQPYNSVSTGAGFNVDDGIDVDSEGNAVMVGFKPGVGIYGRFLDAAGPSLSLNALPSQTMSTSIPLAWTSSDSLSAVQNSTDVYATSAAWNQAAHSSAAVVIDNAPGTNASFQATPGTSYCFQARVSDSSSNASNSVKRCTTLPLDDRKLKGKGWKRASGKGLYLNTVTTTAKQGATLTRKGVQAKRLALVVTKSAKGGKVKVTFNGKKLGSYSLKGKGKKKVIKVASFKTVKAGTVKVIVTSPSGKKVQIDGLVVAK